MSRFKRDLLIMFGIIVTTLVIDYVTKTICINNMRVGESISIIGDFFRLTSARNTGAAWSMFSGERIFLFIVTGLSLLMFGYFAKDINFSNNKIYSIAVSFMFGGTLGNFYDRVVYREVIDFIHFNFFGYDFPIFNFADIFLVSGVIGLIIYFMFLEEKRNANTEV